MLSPLLFILPTEDKQFFNSLTSPLYCVHTDLDLEPQKYEVWKDTQSYFSPFLRNFNRIMILWHHVGCWVIVLALLQAFCGGCETLVQCSDNSFQQSHCQSGHRNDFCIVMSLYVSLVWSSDLIMLVSICDLPNSGILIWKITVSCIFPPLCFVGIFLVALLLLGFFCCFWRGLVLPALLCIYPYWLAPVYFRPLISQENSQNTNSFFCYYILFLFNQLTAFKFSSWILFCLVTYMGKQSSLLKIYVHAFAHAVSFKILPCVWQYLVWMGMLRKICRSRWKTSLENSEGKSEAVEILSDNLPWGAAWRKCRGSRESQGAWEAHSELTQSSPALWQVPQGTKGKEWSETAVSLLLAQWKD